jgi:hypothetical protein
VVRVVDTPVRGCSNGVLCVCCRSCLYDWILR